MLKAIANIPTLHVANWALYSGQLELVQLISNAIEDAEREYDLDSGEWGSFDECLVDLLGGSIGSDIAELLHDDMLSIDDIAEPTEFNGPKCFGGGVGASLFEPLLGHIFRNVDWKLVAKIILDVHKVGVPIATSGHDWQPFELN